MAVMLLVHMAQCHGASVTSAWEQRASFSYSFLQGKGQKLRLPAGLECLPRFAIILTREIG